MALAAVALLAVGSTADAQVAIRSETAPPVQAGGQVRQQYERFANEEWGSETPDDDGYWLQRYMLHLDARVSRKIRAYAELKSAIEVGRTGGPRPPDEDKLDLHQGFVDVSLGPATIRLGRQELAFGSQRLVSVREGPNVRQTFDGASVIVERVRWRVDGFGAKYVATEPGVFDDGSHTGRSLWGVYAVRSTGVAEASGVDLYYLGYRRKDATFDQGLGRELRHSWGARFWRTTQPLDYNFEAVLQAGTFGDTRTLAWTLASDTGYWPNAATRFGVRADITSGDADRSDDRLGTFNPLFPKGAYFGLIAPAGPSNHMDVHPYVTLHPRPEVTMTAGWLLFWRQQLDDGIYGASATLIRSGKDTRQRFVGHSPGVEAEWQICKQISVTGNLSLFTAGPFIRESGPGEDIGFVAGWVTYRF